MRYISKREFFRDKALLMYPSRTPRELEYYFKSLTSNSQMNSMFYNFGI